MRLSFDGFDIDSDTGLLFRDGREVPLEKRAQDMLCYLATHPGRLITRDELLSEVWRARTLSDGAITNTAAKLRKALGQATGAREPIETVRGRGYRWHAARRIQSQPAMPGAQAPLGRTDPFIGRVKVLEVLERAVDQSAQGQGQLLLLTGDAGIGKTRTLDELAKRASARGFSVWTGAAYDGSGAPPYWPWIEILRAAHTDLTAAMFRRYLAADTSAMSLLVPELVHGQTLAAGRDLEAMRFRLFDNIVRFIAAASNDAPRLIVAEDVHWADDATLELLAFAARALSKRPVLLAITLREHEATEQVGRSAVMSRLRRHATHVPLAGLSASELVAALAGPVPIDSKLVCALHQRTQGNPFFVQQTLALLIQRGLSFDSQNLDTLGLPQAVRDLLRQRIQALDATTQRVLQMAATAGTEFDAGLLTEALGVPLAEVLGALELAHRRGVVSTHSTTPHRFVFNHALLRDAIYDELDWLERGRLHAHLGHALQQRAAGSDARSLCEIAHHYLLAVPSELDACVHHCRSAADAARHTLGFETAAEFLARASDKLLREGGSSRLRCELLLALGVDRFCAGDVGNGWQALQQGAAIAEQIDASDLFAGFAFRLAGWLEVGGADEDEVRRLVDRALHKLGDTDPDLRAVLLAWRAELRFDLQTHERYALLDEADGLAARRSAPSVLLQLALCRASLRDPTHLDDSRRAIATYRELARIHPNAIAAPTRSLQSFAIALTEYLCALTAGQLDAADAIIDRCQDLAAQSHVTTLSFFVDVMQAGRAMGDGRLDDVRAAIQRLREAQSMKGALRLLWAGYTVRLFDAQGALASLSNVPELGVAGPTAREDLRLAQRMTGLLTSARVVAKLGDHDTARKTLAGIPSEYVARMPVRYGDLGELCFLAEVYEELHDRAGAAALYSRLLPYAALNAVTPLLDYNGAVAHYLGILAALLDRRDAAAEHFEHAEVLNRQLRMPLQLAWTQRLRAALG